MSTATKRGRVGIYRENLSLLYLYYHNAYDISLLQKGLWPPKLAK